MKEKDKDKWKSGEFVDTSVMEKCACICMHAGLYVW